MSIEQYNTLKSLDVANSKDASVIFTLRDENGTIKIESQMIELQDFDVAAEISTEEISIIGSRIKQTIASDITVKGSFSYLSINSVFVEMVNDFALKGLPILFDLKVRMGNNNVARGFQDLILTGCVPDKVDLAKFTVTSTSANEHSTNFTAGGFTLLETYNRQQEKIV